ncbi:MAG: Wzz/FepE/Etk N-terminal domain-containing protein [Candidatus Latescibacteria bacterium]|jgi:uncharacterized protein involved in exopolysaccharide biosynthesis|nr:Wzz/FepE/Etk N-terminal domain-containing protein [Candidatus Latescibacterota bacterium]
MEEEKEIELIDYINVLVKRKWVIVFGTVICAVAAMVLNAMKGPVPPTYEARASVLVIPPVFRTELTPPQFSMNIYEALAKAQDLEQALVDTLKLQSPGGDALSVAALDPMLDTETVAQAPPSRQQGEVEVPGASLLELIVKSADPDRVPLVRVANTWARLFVQKNSGFTSEEAGVSYEFIRDQYETARNNLYDAEDALNAFNRQHNISVLDKELAAKDPKLSEYQTFYVNNALDLGSKEEALSEVLGQLEAMETREGIWVGAFDVRGTRGISRSSLAEDQRKILDAVVQAREGVLALQERIRTFQDVNDLDFLSRGLKEKQDRHLAYVGQLSEARLQSAATEQTLKEIGGPAKPHGVSFPPGTSLPPDVIRELMSLQVGYDFFGPREEQLEAQTAELKAEVDSLENVQYEKQLELAEMQRKLELVRSIYDTLASDYTEAKKRANTLKISINALRPQVAYQKQTLDGLRREIKSLNAEIADLKLQQSRLNRDIETYKSTFDKFAKLAEDARVTKAKQPGDVKIAARAVGAVAIPPEAGRNVVMLAAAVGLMVSIFLAFFLEYVEKARERQAAEQAQRGID